MGREEVFDIPPSAVGTTGVQARWSKQNSVPEESSESLSSDLLQSFTELCFESFNFVVHAYLTSEFILTLLN